MDVKQQKNQNPGQSIQENDDTQMPGFTDDVNNDNVNAGSKGGSASNDRDLNDVDQSSDQKGKQGFASMPKEEVSRIAKLGGEQAQKSGKAHRWDSNEAKEAGKIGGSR